MTQYHDNQDAADIAGMMDAKNRHSQFPILDEYRAIQSRPIGKGNLIPFVEKEEQGKEIVFTPVFVRGLTGVSVLAIVASVCVSIVQVASTGAFNALFGWIIGGGAVFLLVGGAVGSGSRPDFPDNSGHGGKCGCANITVNNITNIQK